MSPPNGKLNEPTKSWKKVNEERKALRKQRKQDKLLKDIEKGNKVEESTVAATPPKPRPSTISIAVPGSILENAQSAELRTYVAGQIARAACIFRVSEIVVFDDVGLATVRETKRSYEADNDDDAHDGTARTVRSSSLQLARILQYLECPQYLRKFFFPLHKDLKYSGLLNPLDAPHHLRQQNIFRYREGIIVDKKAKPGYSYANVGLLQDVLVDRAIEHGVRVTVKLANVSSETITKKMRGTIVSPDEPRTETGVYWGYTVRIAHAIAEIFTKSPYEGGYDLTVGTSDRGSSVHEVEQKSLEFNHLLIVFGGLKGLEVALTNDDQLNVDDPSLLFDRYINVLPQQGSRTIRTEEALLITLASLQEKYQPKVVEVVDETQREMLAQSDDTGGYQQTFRQQGNKRKNDKEQEVTSFAKKRNENKNKNDSDPKDRFDAKAKNRNSNQEELLPANNPFKPKTIHHKVQKTIEGNEATVLSANNPFDTKTPKKKRNSQAESTDSFEVVTGSADLEKAKPPVDLGDLSRFD